MKFIRWIILGTLLACSSALATEMLQDQGTTQRQRVIKVGQEALPVFNAVFYTASKADRTFRGLSDDELRIVGKPGDLSCERARAIVKDSMKLADEPLGDCEYGIRLLPEHKEAWVAIRIEVDMGLGQVPLEVYVATSTAQIIASE